MADPAGISGIRATGEENVDHVQHMGCEEMDVELIESDDDGVDVRPSKMNFMECRESLKGIANFIAQDACLGDEDMLQVQQSANKLLAMQATCVMNRKQEVINIFFQGIVECMPESILVYEKAKTRPSHQDESLCAYI